MNAISKGLILTPFNLLYKISAEFELKLLFHLKTGRKLDLKSPKGFNEKINWLKLYDSRKSNDLKPYLCDKYTARAYVKKLLGSDEILNELFWEGENPEDIPFDDLPDQFVIKVTHGSTFNIICKDKSKINREKTIKLLKVWLKAKYLPCYGEWWYGIVPPRMIIEKYLENTDRQELLDYKVYCFNGKPRLIDVHCFKNEDKINTYDTDWNYLNDVKFKSNHFDQVEKPAVLDQLLLYAEKLSQDFAHVRVDFIIINNQIYFEELTFATGAGFDEIIPYSFELTMGEWIQLPQN
jgi:hypothetical protein